MRTDMRSSIVGCVWRSYPSANVDERPAERSTFRADESTCSLAVWACVVPPAMMQQRYGWAVTVGCVLITVHFALCVLGRRTIGGLASWSYLNTSRQPCGPTPLNALLRVEASTFDTMAPYASLCPTNHNCLKWA